MTTRPPASVIDDRVEPLLEEFLAEVVTGFRPEPAGDEQQSITTVLTHAAMVSFSRVVTQASPMGRALLAKSLSPALADALAPALAKELAPEIVTALSHLVTVAESYGADPAPVHRETEAAYDNAGLDDR